MLKLHFVVPVGYPGFACFSRWAERTSSAALVLVWQTSLICGAIMPSISSDLNFNFYTPLSYWGHLFVFPAFLVHVYQALPFVYSCSLFLFRPRCHLIKLKFWERKASAQSWALCRPCKSSQVPMHLRHAKMSCKFWILKKLWLDWKLQPILLGATWWGFALSRNYSEQEKVQSIPFLILSKFFNSSLCSMLFSDFGISAKVVNVRGLLRNKAGCHTELSQHINICKGNRSIHIK